MSVTPTRINYKTLLWHTIQILLQQIEKKEEK